MNFDNDKSTFQLERRDLPDPSKPPFTDRYLGLPRIRVKPSLGNNPCLNLDPRDPEHWRRAMDCPMLDIPVRFPPREPAKIATPDLVFSSFQAWAAQDGDIHQVFTIRNIGNGTIASDYNNHVIVQFYASLNMMLDWSERESYEAAGGAVLTNDSNTLSLDPGQEHDFYWQAGSRNIQDFLHFNYCIGTIKLADNHPKKSTEIASNNTSVVPVLVEI